MLLLNVVPREWLAEIASFECETLLFEMVPLLRKLKMPIEGAVSDGLSPSTTRWRIVTLSACTRKTLLAPVHRDAPPAPPQFGFETAGSTTVVPPAPSMSTALLTTTFSR